MKHYFHLFGFAFLLFFASPLYGQSWGIGLRLGDPSGITIKRDLIGKAWELNIGRTRYWNRYKDDWYDRRFYEWYEDKGFKYKDLNYQGYRAAVPLAIQLHYLIQRPLDNQTKSGGAGLDWYYGFGGQARLSTYYYDYRYKREGGGDWIYVTEERVPNMDIGVDAVVGLEYKFKGPIALFMDMTLFMEILDDPFLFWGQGGIGARYRF